MKVALVHDYLNQFGGAERVLETLLEIFPEAPIYTLFYDQELLNGRFRDRTIKTSFLDKPFIRRHHRFFIPLMPKAAENLNLNEEYDLIISDSAGFGKGVSYKKGAHIAYLHTPLRYAWEPELYLETLFPKPLIKLVSPIIQYLRRWDKAAAQKPDIVLANSKFTAQKIKSFYERDAEVLYPPVDTEVFFPDKKRKKNRQNYFLAFGRIVHFKRFDLIVETFNELELPIKIIGSGPEEESVKRLIRSRHIEMIPEIKDESRLREIINGAEAVIFPQIEDFGLVAAESIACGTPVIAYGKGGALEIVQEGKTGLFFEKQTPEDLAAVISKFMKMEFKRDKITESAKKFSKESFTKNLKRIIDSLRPCRA